MLVIIDESAKEVVKIDREEKLKELMDGYSKLVFSICYRLTNDYFTAEDLTQETFLSAYSSLDRFDGRNERAWLSRIATNKCRRTFPTDRTCREMAARKRLFHPHTQMGNPAMGRDPRRLRKKIT